MNKLDSETIVENPTKGWAIHNLVGHPLMQIFIWLRLPAWADWIHDKTIPKQNN